MFFLRAFHTTFVVFAFLSCAVAAFAQTSVIVEHDFEKGSEKWERRGQSVRVRTSDKAAKKGKKSLWVRSRTEFWQGAQLNISRYLKKGKGYRFSAAVRLEEGRGTAPVKMTLHRGNEQFSDVAAGNANESSWTTLAGTYRPTGNEPFVFVFVESADPKVSYFIDDFKIEEFDVNVEQSGTLLKTDFQDGTAQSWLVRGEGVQVFSGQIGSNVVLKVDGRSEESDGLAYDVSTLLFKGRKYKMSVSAVLDAATSSDSIVIRVQYTSPDGESKYEEIASQAVNNTGWTKVTGEYEVKEDGNFMVLIQAKGAKSSFFIDDFELSVP